MRPTLNESNLDSVSFVLEGVVQELHTELSTENLLQQVLQHYQGQSAATGVAAVAGDLFGQAASSAMLAMYDGDYTESFVCLVDGKVVCGSFGGASKLRDGDRIKAVVRQQQEVLVAQAILCEERGLLWSSHPCGTKAERLANFKLGFWALCFSLAMVILGDIVIGPFDKEASRLEFYGTTVLVFGALVLLIGAWVNLDMKSVAKPTTERLRLLGFANPEKINLANYNYAVVRSKELIERPEPEHSIHDVYFYKMAIDDGKVAMAA